jgi:hypothetical protein
MVLADVSDAEAAAHLEYSEFLFSSAKLPGRGSFIEKGKGCCLKKDFYWMQILFAYYLPNNKELLELKGKCRNQIEVKRKKSVIEPEFDFLFTGNWQVLL